MNLKSFSIEQLEAEIKRRKGIESKPVMIDDPDLTFLKVECQCIVDEIVDGNYNIDDDHEHLVYEQAMEAFFGPHFFQWFNTNV